MPDILRPSQWDGDFVSDTRFVLEEGIRSALAVLLLWMLGRAGLRWSRHIGQLSQEGVSIWTLMTSLLVVAVVLVVSVGGSRPAASARVTTVVLAVEGVVAGTFAFLSPLLLADALALFGVSTVTTLNTMGVSRTYLVAAAWFAIVVYRLARSRGSSEATE